ncbi:MAG: ABC transporter permease [Kiritimatiellae bacterium]|nr:ABC transporter permease [Kiritimatiellia bacterium]
MKARSICAVVGIAAAVGAVVFSQSLITTNDAQSLKVAERLLVEVPVAKGAKTCSVQVDFRPDGRVMQGPPMMAFLASAKEASGVTLKKGEAVVTKGFFAQRRIKKLPPVGESLKLIGRKGAYEVKIVAYSKWERPVRGYPNMFVSQETASQIKEEWRPFAPIDAKELSAQFMSDAGRNMDRAKPLLLWAAALTALCLLVNSLFLAVESKRREIAILRMVGMTRRGVAKLVMGEAAVLSVSGFALGALGAIAALFQYVKMDAATFPAGAAIGVRSLIATLVASLIVAVLAALLALVPAFRVKPIEAATGRSRLRRRPIGMLIALSCGYGAFVAVEVWGASLMKPFVPSKEWPDAIVSILPGGVSAFDIEKLKSVPGVNKIAELQPLQVNIEPLEELKGASGRKGGARGKQYRNALLLASDWLPDFKFVQGTREEALKKIGSSDACVITEMMARSRGLSLGEQLKLDAGRGHKMALEIVGIVDLNWHMVTSRALVRGLNRMPVYTDGPVFVSFDTLAACDIRPQELVKMTHLWLNYNPEFLASHGVFPAGRAVERSIVNALDGAWSEGENGEVRGNTVRLHARDEIADGTLAHGAQLIGSMARVPFVFLAVISIGFIAMLVASAESRRREFAVLRAAGATRWQLSRVLIGEALKVSSGSLVIGLFGGAAVGWLCTAGTRAAMASWGLPASFVLPVSLCLWGALGALLFALLIAIPASWVIVRLTGVNQQ